MTPDQNFTNPQTDSEKTRNLISAVLTSALLFIASCDGGAQEHPRQIWRVPDKIWCANEKEYVEVIGGDGEFQYHWRFVSLLKGITIEKIPSVSEAKYYCTIINK